MDTFNNNDKIHYSPTKEECIAFNLDRMGVKAHSISIHSKPLKELNGQLVLIEGNNVTVLMYDRPWALLSSIKQQYIRNNYKAKNLFLKRLSWKKKK